MKNNKFVVLFATLKEPEILAFHKNLRQTHGNEEIALQLFDYLRKVHPNFQDEKKMDPAVVYQKVFKSGFPEKEADRKRALKNQQNTLSELHIWLKDFLLSEKVRHDDLTNQALWLEILKERELTDEYIKQAPYFYKAAKAVSPRNINTYLMEYTACHRLYDSLALNVQKPEINHLQKCKDEMEDCAEIIRLKLECHLFAVNHLRPSKKKEPVLLKTPQSKDDLLLILYRDLYKLLHSGEEIYYARIEQELFANATQLAKAEVQEILTYLRNYCSKQINENKNFTYSKKQHELNKFELQYGNITQDGVLSSTKFTNVVHLACKQKEFEWAMLFIEDQKHLLAEDVRETTVNLSKAIIFFEKGEFVKASQLLNKTKTRYIDDIL